jgi:hypothetical protein
MLLEDVDRMIKINSKFPSMSPTQSGRKQIMTKGQNNKKQQKKTSTKTLKEKRQAKKDKKDKRDSPGSITL